MEEAFVWKNNFDDVTSFRPIKSSFVNRPLFLNAKRGRVSAFELEESPQVTSDIRRERTRKKAPPRP